MELFNLTFQQAVAMNKKLYETMATSIDSHIEEISELIGRTIYEYTKDTIIPDIVRNAFHELGWTMAQDFEVPMAPACIYNMEHFERNKLECSTGSLCSGCPLNFIDDCDYYINKITNALVMYTAVDLCQQNDFANRTSLMNKYLNDVIKTFSTLRDIPIRKTTALDLTEPEYGDGTHDE